jgi:hypothetical protein
MSEMDSFSSPRGASSRNSIARRRRTDLMGFFLCALFDSQRRNCDWQFDSLFFEAKARSVLTFFNCGNV